jgi:uncharacterized protein (TIGR02266 family)
MSVRPADPGPGEAVGGEKMARLLLIGDVGRFVKLLKNYLRRTTCRVNTAQGGEEAMTACRREIPDLVFLEVSVQDTGGIDLCRSLKTDPVLRAIPIVMVSPRELIGLCREAGCDEILPKPVTQEDFLARVRRFVSLRERMEGRIPVSLRVEFRARSKDHAAYTRDLSPHGTFIKSPQPLAVGTRLKLKIHLPGGKNSLALDAEVMRVVRPTAGSHLLPGLGVRFLDVSPEARRVLQEFIDERLSS